MNLPNPLNFCCLPRTVIRVTGKDRLRVINNFFTNQMPDLASHSNASNASGVEGLITNAKGRIHSHAFVFVFEEQVLIETLAENTQNVIEHIDRYVISEKVQFETVEGFQSQCLMLYGEPAKVLELFPDHNTQQISVANFSTESDPQYHTLTNLLGWPTAQVHVSPAKHHQIEQAWLDAGATRRSLEEFENDRINLGIPLFGTDYTDANFPQELARDDDLISFTKGCYLGQETIARIDSLGHVNKFVSHIALPADVKIDVLPFPLQKGEKSIGHITSVACIPNSPHCPAIATLRVPFHQPGTRIETNIGEVSVL